MRFIYLVKLAQLAAILAVVWLFLEVGTFCGEIELKANYDQEPMNDSPIDHEITVQRDTPTHWSSKLAEIKQNESVASNATLNKHPMKKRGVIEVVSKLNRSSSNATTKLATSFHPKIVSSAKPTTINGPSVIEDGTTMPELVTTSSATAFQRFEWRADGCIPVSACDFFSYNSETHASKIVSQLKWSVIFVLAHLFVVLFQVYLVYDSHLPPSAEGDFVRIIAGFFLWYGALCNLVIVHYNWEYEWKDINIMIAPDFPTNWVIIEVISIAVILSLMFEEISRDWLYANMRIASTPRVSSNRAVEPNTQPILN